MTFVDVFQYVGYMRKHSADAVRNIFRRACEVHLPKKSSMHLAWAAFEETQGGLHWVFTYRTFFLARAIFFCWTF